MAVFQFLSNEKRTGPMRKGVVVVVVVVVVGGLWGYPLLFLLHLLVSSSSTLC